MCGIWITLGTVRSSLTVSARRRPLLPPELLWRHVTAGAQLTGDRDSEQRQGLCVLKSCPREVKSPSLCLSHRAAVTTGPLGRSYKPDKPPPRFGRAGVGCCTLGRWVCRAAPWRCGSGSEGWKAVTPDDEPWGPRRPRPLLCPPRGRPREPAAILHTRRRLREVTPVRAAERFASAHPPPAQARSLRHTS